MKQAFLSKDIKSLGLLAASACLLATAVFNPAIAQQGHYEFVPGSRQARWVPGPAAGAVTPAPYTTPTAASYAQPAASTAGQVSGRGHRQFVIDAATGQMYTGSPAGYGRQLAPVTPGAGYPAGYPASRTTGPAATTAVSTPASGSPARATTSRAREYMDQVPINGYNRTFLVHLPPGYTGKQALPVVLAFHGLGMNSTMMYGLTGFSGLSDRKNFIVVFPNSASGKFQDGLSKGEDDVMYVKTMLDKLERTLAVDRRRIYICGISNGGYFSQLLALSMPERIAACGVVASTMTAGAQAASSGSRTMPIVFFEGVDDPLLPWDDGRTKDLGKLGEALGISQLGSIDGPLAKMGGLYTVPETINFWLNYNHAPTSAQVTSLPDAAPSDGTRVELHSWGSGANQVMLYKIGGGGHTWPGALNLKAISGISGNISQDIDATALLWDFFSKHNL